jgi:O-methyltransferase
MKSLGNIFDLPNDSKVAIYGIGKFSEYVEFILVNRRSDIEILFYIIQDSKLKTKKDHSGKPIYSLEEENDLLDEIDYVLVCDDYMDFNELNEANLPDYFLLIKPEIISSEIENDLNMIYKRLGIEYVKNSYSKDEKGLVKINSEFGVPTVVYNSDSLIVIDKNLPFNTDKKFINAYKIASSQDKIINISYRAYICCWAAQKAMKLEGDFVECGVNKGILSRTVIEYIDFYNIKDKKFYLFDTYEGLVDSQQLHDIEKLKYDSMWKHKYKDCFDEVKNYFKDFDNVELVKGIVPDSLSYVNIDKISYLSIDMNCAYPEIEAINFFWDKLVSGAVVILDDYGWISCEPQKIAFDKFAEEKNISILTLPTGQGMIIKP